MNKVTVSSLEALQDMTSGYMHIFLSDSPNSTHFETIKQNDTNYIITHGCYINPVAASILQNNAIEVLAFDTTFRLLPNYVTSLLFCIFRNTGIPLAISFTKSESRLTYQLFFEMFQSTFNIDLSKYYAISDEGRSLISIFKQYNIQNFFCQWHLLHGLGYKPFTFEVGLLIKAVTQSEFNYICELLEPSLSQAFEDSSLATQLIKTLSKIGLSFQNNKIIITDSNVFEKHSTICRVPLRIPKTTGHVESTHGHGNHRLPRRNRFFTGFFRLIQHSNIKINSVDEDVLHNIQRQNRLSKLRISVVGETTMEQECIRYNTRRPDQCSCTEKLHANSLYQGTCICSHLLYCGQPPFLIIPPKLHYTATTTEFHIYYHNSAIAINRGREKHN
jgi:hypothetical protein